jgi:hypothetical protein
MYDEIDEIRNMEIKRIKLEQDRIAITDTLKIIKKRYTQDVSAELEKSAFQESQDGISRHEIIKERFVSDKQVIELKKKLEDSILQTKLIKIDIKYAGQKLHYHNLEKSNDPNVFVKFLSEISRSINQIATNTRKN